MATQIEKIGYGQVEPNRLSAQKTKQVFAQLPAADDVTVIENGMALVYDNAAGEVTYPTEGGVAHLVMNEIILADERYQADSDFVMFNIEETDYQVALGAYPRMFPLMVGDTITTNTVAIDSTDPVGKLFHAGADGYWTEATDVSDSAVALVCTKDYTMPDGQRGLKLLVTKADYSA